MTGKSRNLAIDWLRGLASVWVVMFHINEPFTYVPTLYRWICKCGWLGVPAFFAISGYCIAMITIKLKSPWIFLQARLIRILLPYWASIAVVLAVVAARKIITGVNDVTYLPRGFGEVFATLSLTTKPVSNVGAINWVYWTLSYEVAFYLIVAGSLLIAKFTSKTTYWLCVSAGASIASHLTDGVSISPFFFSDKLACFFLDFSHFAFGKQEQPLICYYV